MRTELAAHRRRGPPGVPPSWRAAWDAPSWASRPPSCHGPGVAVTPGSQGARPGPGKRFGDGPGTHPLSWRGSGSARSGPGPRGWRSPHASARTFALCLPDPGSAGRLPEQTHLIVDSTGLSIVGEGEWAAAKHGRKGKRGWRKLHLGVDRMGIIVAQVLTDGNADDAATVPALLDQLDGGLTGFVADAAYDSRLVYDAATVRGAAVVVPPRTDATIGGANVTPCSARDRTVARIREVGRRRWKKESGYHRQGTVENIFFRYKSILRDRLRARHPAAQRTEALIACNVLNRMFELGRPASIAIGR